MSLFGSEEEEALRGAFARTVALERLRRGYAFERYRQAFEGGLLGEPESELEPGWPPDGPYQHTPDDPDPDAEIEQLLSAVRAELDR